ncbi:MAG: hypothetical protein D3925_08590 [Candidatus Electrothrix sp. AR5]|nr:hypothetical protein [Candidatus Electrothrix sp. AR5]
MCKIFFLKQVTSLGEDFFLLRKMSCLVSYERLRKFFLCGKESESGRAHALAATGLTVFIHSIESAEKDFYYEKDYSARR